MASPKLSKLELQIMETLWAGGGASIREIQEALAARRKDVPEGQWITSMGGWHPNQWAEHRHPTRRELDQAVPDHFQKANLTTLVAVSHRCDERSAQELRRSAGISLQESNYAQFTGGPGCQAFVPEILCYLLDLQPVLLLRSIINLDVGVTLCGEAPEAQPGIVTHHRVLQLVVQESRELDESHRLGF